MTGDPKARDTVVRLAAVHKTYRLYDHPSARLRELFSGKPRHTAFQALADISFDVGRGETLGVVGANGSGKSTLLKLIAGVVKPSGGTLTRHGRVSAVLELGAGFDPEFSGRSNARLNSAIMGFSPRQVEERLERIAAFAEIGEFMDRPVKTYSTGMLARLAFACAVHLDPDILLVDEALAVGDMFFQAKCMAHMRHMIEEQGTTLLFVSHDTVAVTQLCTKALYLEQGRIKAWGQALEVTDAYRRDVQLKLSRRFAELSPAMVTPPTQAPLPNAVTVPATHDSSGSPSSHGAPGSPSSHGSPASQVFPGSPVALAAPPLAGAVFRADANWEAQAAPGRYGLGRARFRNVEVLDAAGNPRNCFDFQESITVRAHLECLEDMDAPHCALLLRNKEGVQISHVYTVDTFPYKFPPLSRGDRLLVQFTFANIFRGNSTYVVYLAVNNAYTVPCSTVEDQVPIACMFASRPEPHHPIHYLIWQDFQIAHSRLPGGLDPSDTADHGPNP